MKRKIFRQNIRFYSESLVMGGVKAIFILQVLTSRYAFVFEIFICIVATNDYHDFCNWRVLCQIKVIVYTQSVPFIFINSVYTNECGKRRFYQL